MAVLAYFAQVLNDADWEKIGNIGDKRRSIPTQPVVYEASVIILNSGPTVEQLMMKTYNEYKNPFTRPALLKEGSSFCADVQEAVVTEE